MDNSTNPVIECKTAPGEQGRTPQGVGASLPCLNSNISIENAPRFQDLSTQHRKTAFILKESVEALAARYGIDHLGFLTLTFPVHITDPKEAQKRLNSLLTNVIKKRYSDYVGVFERQKSGRIHYHLLVVLNQNIRLGCDFEAFARRDYRSASAGLKIEWRYWRDTAKKYGFGRTELLPVKSSSEAISKYVGKYIAKHVGVRQEADKGVRLVRYSTGARVGTTRFQFHSQGSQEWRRKVGIFVEILRSTKGWEIRDISDIATHLGPRWCYHHGDFIRSLP